MKKALFTCFCSMFVTLASFASINFTVAVSSTSCPSALNGSIIITVANGTAPFQYSIDGGNNFSASNIFTGLAAGVYNLMVLDGTGDSGTQQAVVMSGPVITNSIDTAICVNHLPYLFGTTNIVAPGTYQHTFITSMGCDSIVMLQLSILPVETSSVNIFICPSQLPYTWQGQQYNAGGVYQQTFTAASGCDSISMLNLNVLATNEWLGTLNSSWEEPLNWSCGVPGPDSDVVINSGTVVLHANTTINSLTLDASATLTISTGIQLTILH